MKTPPDTHDPDFPDPAARPRRGRSGGAGRALNDDDARLPDRTADDDAAWAGSTSNDDARLPGRFPDPPAGPGNRRVADRPADWNVLDDGLAENQRWSTWPSVEKLLRGPAPYPEFVIEDAGAIDTDLGVLKTGKEADVFLIERATAEHGAVLAAKRYRSPEQRLFHRSSAYTEGRSVRRSRDARALKGGTTYGRAVEASRWAASEWAYLRMAFDAGAPVPYPVQLCGTEILMEFIADPAVPGAAAPRLHQLHPGPERLSAYWEQVVDAMDAFARLGFAHGDLSPYNVLGAGDRIVVIDLPQFVDLAGNSRGMELLARDCRNMCGWFSSRGMPVDADELFARLVASAW